MTGIIFDIKEMAVHDGPGLRTTVFLKGCPLRCLWCHNPEGLSPKPQLYVRKHACLHCGLCRRGCSHPDCQPFGRCLHICPSGLVSVSGREISSEDLASALKNNLELFGNDGGVTFSGGEPLMQAEFLLEVAAQLDGIHLALETSGHAPSEVFRAVISNMNYVYMDLKLADRELHKQYTGVYNDQILKNLEILRASGVPCTIRTPLIPGITDTSENLAGIKKLVGELPHELLSNNAMAGAKYDLLDMEFPLNKRKEVDA